MANGNIRGITVEFGGDTTKLGKALDTIFKDGKKVDSALKDVNKSLKFDPKNTELLSQKQALLAKKIDQTKKRLDVLKQAQATLDASGVDKSSDEYMKLRRQIMQAEGQLGAYETQLRRVESTQRSQQSAMEKLEGTISDQERELKALKDEYKNYVIEGKESSDAAKELEGRIQQLSGELADNKKSMSNAEKAADKLDRSMGDVADATEKASDAAKDSGGGFSVMKGAMADLVSKGIQKAIDAVKEFAKAVADTYEGFKEGTDIIIEKTGAQGDALVGLKKSYKNVSKEFAGSFDDIGTAIGEVNTRFGVTGEELENLSLKFLKFADLNGTDVNGAIDSVQKTLSAWGMSAGDAGSVLDALNKVGQDTGISMDTLSGYLMENASTFKQLGLDVYQSANYLGTLEKSGVSTSTAMTALQKASAYAAKSGKPLTETLADTAKKMKNSKSEAETLQIAYDVFGKKAGAKIADGLKTGTISFEDLDKAMQNSAGSVDQTYEATQDGMDKIKLAFQGAKAEIGEAIGRFLDEHKEEIEGAISTALDAIKGIVDFVSNNKEVVIGVITAIAAAIAAMKIAGLVSSIAAIANPIGLIVTGIMAVIAILAACYAKFEWFRDGVNSVIDFIASIFEAIGPVIKASIDFLIGIVTGWVEMIQSQFEFVASLPDRIADGWSSLVEWFNGWVDDWKRLGSDIVAVASSIVSGVVGFFTSLKEKVSGVFSSVKAAASDAWNNIKNAVLTRVKAIKDGVINWFTALKDKVTSIFNNVKTAITKPVEAAKDKISKIVEKIKGFFSKMKLSIPKISLPKMPKFALSWSTKTVFGKEIKYPSGIDVSWHKDGGIFTSPTLLHGVGEAGAEAVLPLDMLWKKFDDMADSIVSGMATVMRSYSSGGNVGDIHLDVYLYPNGPKMGEQIVRAYDTYKPRLG